MTTVGENPIGKGKTTLHSTAIAASCPRSGRESPHRHTDTHSHKHCCQHDYYDAIAHGGLCVCVFVEQGERDENFQFQNGDRDEKVWSFWDCVA